MRRASTATPRPLVGKLPCACQHSVGVAVGLGVLVAVNGGVGVFTGSWGGRAGGGGLALRVGLGVGTFGVGVGWAVLLLREELMGRTPPRVWPMWGPVLKGKWPSERCAPATNEASTQLP